MIAINFNYIVLDICGFNDYIVYILDYVLSFFWSSETLESLGFLNGSTYGVSCFLGVVCYLVVAFGTMIGIGLYWFIFIIIFNILLFSIRKQEYYNEDNWRFSPVFFKEKRLFDTNIYIFIPKIVVKSGFDPYEEEPSSLTRFARPDDPEYFNPYYFKKTLIEMLKIWVRLTWSRKFSTLFYYHYVSMKLSPFIVGFFAEVIVFLEIIWALSWWSIYNTILLLKIMITFIQNIFFMSSNSINQILCKVHRRTVALYQISKIMHFVNYNIHQESISYVWIIFYN